MLQVFLLESQQGERSPLDNAIDENQSYVFLVYPPTGDKTGTDSRLTRYVVVLHRWLYSCSMCFSSSFTFLVPSDIGGSNHLLMFRNLGNFQSRHVSPVYTIVAL